MRASSVICEWCEREKVGNEGGWQVGREGEDVCGECADALLAEMKRQRAALPQRIGLCPTCAPDFYYPLAEGEEPTCPTPECGLRMVVYERGAEERITHGRHCRCAACEAEDWTNPALAPCGMHGSSCPREYAPLGRAGEAVPR